MIAREANPLNPRRVHAMFVKGDGPLDSRVAQPIHGSARDER